MARIPRSTLLLAVTVIAASALVVVLAVKQTALNKAYAELKLRATRPHPGYAVPAFTTRSLSGDTLTVGESKDPAAKQVLFVLTTTCPYCRATLPVWAALADSLGHTSLHVRVLAISLDSLERTRRYVSEHQLRYTVVTFPNDKYQRLYRANSVPQTVVLDGAGAILYAHVGLLRAGPVLDSVYQAVLHVPVPQKDAAAERGAQR